MRSIKIPGVPIYLSAHMLVSWWAGTALGLHGTKLWVFRGLLMLVGLAGVGVFLWFKHNRKKQEEAANAATNPAQAGESSDDIDSLIRDAEAKLATAQVQKGVKLGSLPAIFLIGETGTAKTTTIVNSGLDAELLAGQVYQDTNLVPTRAANLWYAKRAVFVEAGGRSVSDPSIWTKIAKKLQPGRLGSVVAQGQAPRAALVTIEAESLMRPGASDALAATARALRSRLGEISQALGINLPVYVLVTKMDRVAFFPEYVRNLTNEESAQVLGVTVPVALIGGGVYAEQETARLNGSFEQLVRSLANARPQFLAREHEPANLPPVYEFPREFRKLRPTLVQFLVDLCRPSQLTVSPFLRGFYFSGVRPIVVNEVAPSPVRQQSREQEVSFGATGIFRPDARGVTAAPQQVVGTRKVPQWLFLTHFFHKLLLADQVAMGASQSSTKTSMLRRVLLASAAALCLLYSIALIVSYSKNRALETEARDAARGIDAVNSGTSQKVASLDSLQRLETLRQSLVVLTGYDRDGAPLGYRWGLYIGDTLYPEVRRLYFDCFKRVLFGQTQAALLETLRTLPPTPGPGYQPTYETLKAYLITTSNHDKSTREFLSPVLLNRWSANKNVDADRVSLAQRQFDFYSGELKVENPYEPANDGDAVKKARDYLHGFEGIERVYAAMIADAAKKSQPVNFNKQFPDAVSVVSDSYEVAGPFTKKGFDFMKTALKNPSQYFSGEEWVLGPSAPTQGSMGGLGQQLADRYYSDYKAQWRAYLKAASVGRYANLQDAGKKLSTLSANTSPLLALVSLASQNTDVDSADVKSLFQPVQSVVPPANADRYIAPSNQPYMSALLKLQSSVEQAASAQPLTDATAAPTLSAALDAKTTTGQMAQNFTPDKNAADAGSKVDRKVQQLLEDPITYVQAFLKGLGPAELNGKGKALCAQWRTLLGKYPFNPNSKVDASMADVNGIFHKPDGALWTFYDANLQKYLVKQGAQYVAVSGSPVTLSDGFVRFFNRSAAFTDAIYAGNTPDPHVGYSLKPLSTEGIKAIRLQLDGQPVTSSGKDGVAKPLVWQGSGAHEAKLFVDQGSGETAWSTQDGLWAIFRLFGQADRMQPEGGGYRLEWYNRTGQDQHVVTIANGSPLSARFLLDMNGAPPIFQKGYLAQLTCVADVAK